MKLGHHVWTPEGSATTLPDRRPGLDVGLMLEALAEARPVTVVVPVYNGGDAVRVCLDSVLRWTADAQVVVIDDASTDPSTVALLDELARTRDLQLIRHEENWGYTRTANHALHLDERADVVLVNSDTEVGPRWLQRLRWVAASQVDVATVSAVSDNAGAMAVPEPGVANIWPTHLPWDEVALAATHADLPWGIETPTGHGFCMLVTRAAITRLHGFDEARFPRGYGEENDFSMRASEAGMRNLVAGHVLVRHERSQSFGSEKELLIAEGRNAVDERHPTYTQRVRAWMASPEMADLRERHEDLRRRVSGDSRVKPRRLYVLHRAGGGTPATNLDLMTALSDYQDSYLVESAELRKLVLHKVTKHGAVTLATWETSDRFRVTDTWRQDYAEVMAEWIVRLGIETVHVRHLINQPLTALSEVTRRLGVRLIVSTHDFYLACPSVHLLDQDDRFCGGRCTPGPGVCRMPTAFVADALDLKHHWIHEWRRRTSSVLDVAEAVVATTPSAASILAGTYPQLANGVTLIEHGRDIDAGWESSRPDGARQDGPIRILAVSNWAEHKGISYLRAMGQALGREAEIHVLGQRSELLADVGVIHGRYQREEFPSIVREIDPDLVALVSIWPETYSHTLTEAWALGVPVIATDIGAVAERIRQYGGGTLVPVDDPQAAAERVRDLAADPAELTDLRRTVPRNSVRTRAAMAEDYRSLYDRKLMEGPARTRLGYVARGELGHHPGSVHVRLLRRLVSPTACAEVSARQVFPDDVVRRGGTDVDVLVVQRDALVGDPAPLLDVLARERVRLVVDLDDDLVTEHRAGVADGADAGRTEALRTVLREADQVLVSTDVLAERIAPLTAGRLTVVPNQLDPRVWSSEVVADPAPRRDEYRVLYMGSRTHLDDLLLLREPIEALQEVMGKRVVLEVVGVAERFDEDEWVKRLRLPKTMRDYPDFVRWLRTHRQRWHAAVAPLVDTPFNAMKSDLKLVEYAGLGVPVVASRVGPYATADDLAVLTGNTKPEWVAALSSVLGDADCAGDVAARARETVWSQRLLGTEADRWLDAVLGRA